MDVLGDGKHYQRGRNIKLSKKTIKPKNCKTPDGSKTMVQPDEKVQLFSENYLHYARYAYLFGFSTTNNMYIIVIS